MPWIAEPGPRTISTRASVGSSTLLEKFDADAKTRSFSGTSSSRIETPRTELAEPYPRIAIAVPPQSEAYVAIEGWLPIASSVLRAPRRSQSSRVTRSTVDAASRTLSSKSDAADTRISSSSSASSDRPSIESIAGSAWPAGGSVAPSASSPAGGSVAAAASSPAGGASAAGASGSTIGGASVVCATASIGAPQVAPTHVAVATNRSRTSRRLQRITAGTATARSMVRCRSRAR